MATEWYYSKGNGEVTGPVTRQELERMLAAGELPADVLVWCQGMEEWKTADKVSELGAASSAAPSPQAAAAAAAPAAEPAAAATPVSNVVVPGQPTVSHAATDAVPGGLGGWMAFLGIANIIMGIIQCLSCFGLPMGILTIIAGAALISARSALSQVESVDPTMGLFLAKLRTYMVIMGIFFLISLLMLVAAMIFYASFLPTLIQQAGGHIPR